MSIRDIKVRNTGQADTYLPAMDSDNSSNLTLAGSLKTSNIISPANLALDAVPTIILGKQLQANSGITTSAGNLVLDAATSSFVSLGKQLRANSGITTSVGSLTLDAATGSIISLGKQLQANSGITTSAGNLTLDAATGSVIALNKQLQANSGITTTLEFVGPGTTPVGTIMAILSDSPLTGGTYPIPAAGTVDSNGWMWCGGTVPQRVIPGGNTLTGSVPDLSDGRYLRGSTVSGTTSGANTVTISSANLPLHTHGYETLVNAPEALHTHTKSGSITAEGSHYHASVALSGNLVNAALASNIHTHGAHTGGSITNTGSNTAVTGSITSGGNTTVTGTSGAGSSHGHGITQSGAGAHTHTFESDYKTTSPLSATNWSLDGQLSYHTSTHGMSNPGDHGHSVSVNAEASHTHPAGLLLVNGVHGHSFSLTNGLHTHGFTLPSDHTGIELGHNHTISGHTGAVCAADGTTAATHTHADTIAYGAGSSHNHAISGSTSDGGFANTATNNEPQYMNVRYLIRVK